jgi:hypothetical protein
MRAQWQLTALCAMSAVILAACHTNQAVEHRKVPSHASMSVDYSTFDTIEQLRAALVAPFGDDGHLYTFEKDNVKTALCLQRRGGIGWDTVIIYSFQDSSRLWVPYVLWNTQNRGVTVKFDHSTGTIEVHSGGGALIFQTTINALKARQVPWGW